MAIEFDNSSEMARQYWIVEYHGNKANRILHVTTKPRNEKGAYVELKSLNGFRQRCIKRVSKLYDHDVKMHRERLLTDPDARMLHTSLTMWYDVRDSRQWQVDNAVMAGMRDSGSALDMYDGAPVVAAGGVFDMYALIGYDHRRDRYTAPGPAPASV